MNVGMVPPFYVRLSALESASVVGERLPRTVRSAVIDVVIEHITGGVDHLRDTDTVSDVPGD
jgi:hypothetical protein